MTFGNVIQVHRDGRIEHDLRDMPQSFAPFRTVAARLGLLRTCRGCVDLERASRSTSNDVLP